MARKPAPTTKSETLSIRLDPKTRFVLEYVSRLKGQTITTVVERAIVAAADQQTIPDREHGDSLDWRDFWDVSDGVRAIKLGTRREFFPTYEEEKRIAFCEQHWPFFWATASKRVFINHYVDLLWPRIDDFVTIYDDSKANATDINAAADAMKAVLRGANVEPPRWPPVNRSMDDEIPF